MRAAPRRPFLGACYNAPMPAKSRRTTPPVIEDEEYVSSSSPLIGEADTLTFKRGQFYWFMAVVAFCMGLIIGYMLPGRTSAADTQPSVAQAPAGTAVPIKYNIVSAGFPSVGPANAPIVIVEFSDYQCPFCTQWHDTTYQPLMAAYPGKIRLVYRNFPLPFHQNAFKAAEAAMCAGDQNAYWQYHDKLFASNDQLNNAAGTTLDPSFYVGLAQDLGLDTTTFSTCLNSDEHKAAVQSDLDYANGLPIDSDGTPAVSGTPTFFINGYRIVGAEPLAYFEQVIDAQLKAQ
jgi:protein-disulfide isomerase